jgi:hypothetical protein
VNGGAQAAKNEKRMRLHRLQLFSLFFGSEFNENAQILNSLRNNNNENNYI